MVCLFFEIFVIFFTFFVAIPSCICYNLDKVCNMVRHRGPRTAYAALTAALHGKECLGILFNCAGCNDRLPIIT